MKQTGSRPGPRSGLSLTPSPPGRAYLFGGVQDEEDEEVLKGHFFNDLYVLELDKGHWRTVVLRGEGTVGDQKKKRQEDEDRAGDKGGDKQDAADDMQQLTIEEPATVTCNDGVFTVTIGCSKGAAHSDSCAQASASKATRDAFVPLARMNACMAVKHNVLYLYGGMFEDGDKQFTLSDMYSLDLHKLDQWDVLVPLDSKTQEWLGSDSESDEEEDEEEDMELDEEESGEED